MSEKKTWESSENKWFETGYSWTEVDLQEIALIENIPVSPIGGVGKTTIEPKKLGSDGSNFKSSNGSESGEALPGTDSESSTNDYGGALTDENPLENKEYAINSPVYEFAVSTYEAAKELASKVIQYFTETGQNIVLDWKDGWSSGVAGRDSIFGENVDGFFGAINNVMAGEVSNLINDLMNNLSTLIGDITGSLIGDLFSKLGNMITTRLLPYGSGEDPSFASQQASAQEIWQNGIFSQNGEYRVNIIRAPLNFDNLTNSIYGSMILGTPFLYGDYADPVNRSLINSIVKDGRVISITPGLPKYNGSYYTMGKNNYQTLTQTFAEMASYLLTNGINSINLQKDKRYYTFEAKYDEYFAYLETILNVVYARMGLASITKKEFNYLTFTNALVQDSTNGDSYDPNGFSSLQDQYKNSLGFFINNVNLSEDISNNETSVGTGLASDTNQVSDKYQELNYLTGMGTGGAVNDTRRLGGIVFRTVEQARNVVNQYFSRTSSAMSGGWSIPTIIKTVAAAIIDTVDMASNNDVGLLMESFMVTNGMKVMYPELWSDSRVSKSVSIDFSFTSPYGDPASIFKYVYVPFFALLTFAMPRMAADNAYISPFFVRASIPGVFNSDLAMISNMNWQRGGPNNLWTKDNLPRCISGSFTISDLYPYLSLIKGVSCLSHNPSYSIWTDSFAGQRAIYTENDTDPMGNYFKQTINRISGIDNAALIGGLWNRFSTEEMNANQISTYYSPNPLGLNISGSSIKWMTKI